MDINIEEAGKLFDLADDDKNGALSREEVQGIMTQLNSGVVPGPVELKNAFDAMDQDGNGRIDRQEFLTAMTGWLHLAEDSGSRVLGAKRVIGSPQGSPGGASNRKKATLNMASFFKQFAGADGKDLRQRIENHQPPGVELNVDLMTILRDYPNPSVAEKLAYFDEATVQMSVSTRLFVTLHSPQWDEIEVALQVVGKFLEVVEIFHFRDEKIELWPLFDQVFTFFTAVDTSGAVPGEPLSIIRRVVQLLRLAIPASKQVQFYTLCLQALTRYIPGPGFPCARDSHWHPSEQLTRNIMRHEQLVPSLYKILKEHGSNIGSLETVHMLEAHAKCLQIFCESWFEIADVAISEYLRQGVRMLMEAILAQKEGPVDSSGTRHGLDAFAPLLQHLLGALSVLCGFTHEEGHSNFELFRMDVAEAESIMTVTGVCIQFLTNCQVLQERQVAMIYISIIWQYLLPVLPKNLPLFSNIIQENIRLLGFHWDLSPAGVQVVVNLLMSAAELMEGGASGGAASSAVYIALWDHTQSDFKNHFRRQFQVGFQGGLNTWPICKACYHVLLLLLERGQQDHLIVPTDAKDPLSYFGAIVFQQSRFLLSTAEDTHLVTDFLCKCLRKDDLVDTLLSVGMVDGFFGFFTRFKTNYHAISDIFNKHVVPTYEIHALTEVIIALKRFLEYHSRIEGSEVYKAFTLDHMDAAELLHAVICRELRRYRLRMSLGLQNLVGHLEELVKMMAEVHVAQGSLIKDSMAEELKVMAMKWTKDRDDAYKLGIARSLPKAVYMDIQCSPLWANAGIKGFVKSTEPRIFRDLPVVAIDFHTLQNELGQYYKRPVSIFGTHVKSIVILNQEDLAKHFHRFVKTKDSTEKIFVEFFVDVDEGGEVKQSQNAFDMGMAMGNSSKQNDLQQLLANAGTDKKKLESNQTVTAFYEYFKTNGIKLMDEDTFTQIMVSSIGFEPATAKSAFLAFDYNHDGSLSIQEIAIGFSQLSSGDATTCLKMLFDIYDVDHNEKLDVAELTDLIRKATKMSLPDANQMANAGIAKQDSDGDGMLDLNEFTQLARSGVIDLGLDFPHKKDKGREREGGGRSDHGYDSRDSRDYGHDHGRDHRDNKKQARQQDNHQDNRKSQLCSFLFTKGGCSHGELCSFKHDDISRATRGEKEKILKNLERMKRKDIDYDALK